MSSHAKDGKLIEEIVSIAAKICRSSESDIPGTRVGRPPVVPYWVLGTMITVGVLLRKRSKSAQYAWWGHAGRGADQRSGSGMSRQVFAAGHERLSRREGG